VAPELSSARVRSRLGELALQLRAHHLPGAEVEAFLADVSLLGVVATAEVINPWPV
jgi:hypothetical protein